MNNSKKIFKPVFSGVCLSLAFVLPFLTMHIPKLGQLISPMHLPIFVCGFICGWKYGLAAGLVAPILRSLILGMPPMLPTAVSMAIELAVYGAVSGILSRKLPQKVGYTYLSLISAMLAGRIIGGGFQQALLALMGKFDKVGISFFLASYFVEAIPAIIIQIVIIPPIVILLRKTGTER